MISFDRHTITVGFVRAGHQIIPISVSSRHQIGTFLLSSIEDDAFQSISNVSTFLHCLVDNSFVIDSAVRFETGVH